MAVLEQLKPQEVFHFFEELCKIPHGTFDTKRISDYCVEFAKERGLEFIQDDANNVIIRKPGTAGYEDSEPVIIQGHLDMVCEKTEDSTHNFDTDGLELLIEDGYVTAKDTTLGGDDGIAIAFAMAVLDSKDIPHPPIEAIFTTDEEVGMGGATAIDMSPIKGKMLLNLDSDNEGVIVAGCSGGYVDTVTIPVEREERQGSVVTIQVKGLRGGHSGLEIHEQRGNSNKMMGRLLNHLNLNTDIALVAVDGGTKDNVITSMTTAKVVAADADAVVEMVKAMEANWFQEFAGEEPGLTVITEVSDETVQAMTKAATQKIIHFVYNSPYGVQEYSRALKGLVETSLNCGVVATSETDVKALLYVRSSVNSKLDEMHEALCAFADILGGTCVKDNEYPAWMYKHDSKIRPLVIDTYKEMFGEEPIVNTVHAGLECGLLSGKKPDLDCVSYGPEMLDIHSVAERLNIESTQRMWEFTKELLKRCK
ncbi:aminoacyl-histidine dipeptidase [Bariatricus massiliensis]|uniref:Aminoacyl-histidine dipeptidase n=1 Tax=Bariatricus massiliensis TaxID=1745713 RepID=A0ABS8DCG0_9FIRM|nr:aminoacyl-histidine dipeptidase [Bariatricus massiliensis]MCB7303303.1 aminoacyl-histidine dipeptidase [Bariatricus massiliensis]MCB7373435.1 aminoacyl-histidine dipeptidase [Bariatricus massiliensis]MCB7386105.1 aminoacyl-histidine dipeptidase [Bariatricus massiliensis]MCB7410267.1 aminoacyl-histidine dipeptidase [Bariatricus massiliensis]MCQ5252449.1 aminoacyl-histidine dipeptidase [Bariatricus massiliensis]